MIVYFCEIMHFFVGKNTPAYQLNVLEDIYAFQYVLNVSIRKKLILRNASKNDFFEFLRKWCLFASKTFISLSSIKRPIFWCQTWSESRTFRIWYKNMKNHLRDTDHVCHQKKWRSYMEAKRAFSHPIFNFWMFF